MARLKEQGVVLRHQALGRMTALGHEAEVWSPAEADTRGNCRLGALGELPSRRFRQPQNCERS